jgi:hypothetical protein
MTETATAGTRRHGRYPRAHHRGSAATTAIVFRSHSAAGLAPSPPAGAAGLVLMADAVLFPQVLVGPPSSRGASVLHYVLDLPVAAAVGIGACRR